MPMLPDIPPETVHGRDGSLIFVESPIDLARCIIDIAHEHTGWPSAFKPVMVGAVHLYHLPISVFPGPPLPMLSPFTLLLPELCLYQPYTKGFIAYTDTVSLKKLLLGQSRPKPCVVLPV